MDTVITPAQTQLAQWQKLLVGRGLLGAATKAAWQPNGTGWKYPVYDLDEKRIENVWRWKAFDSASKPKYRWEPKEATNRPLYYVLPGLRAAIEKDGGTLILASGEPDVLAFRAAGAENVLCWYGEGMIPSSLVADLKLLGVSRVECYPDLDQTGENWAVHIAQKLNRSGISFNAYVLPGAAGSKTDINRIWINCGFDQDKFWDTLGQTNSMSIVLPEPTLPEPPKDEYDDLPEGFYTAIERGLGVKEYKDDGWSKHVQCPLKHHEHDDKEPAASWHKEKRILSCFKCNTKVLAKEVGEALGLNWKDFIPPKPISVPRTETAKVAGQPPITFNYSEAAKMIFGELQGELTSGIHEPLPMPFKAVRALGGLAASLAPGKIIAIAGDSGDGKAQPLDSKILTPDGWTCMGNIRVGNKVIGSDGKPYAVSGVYPQGGKEIFRITFDDGTSTECCEDHLWNVRQSARRNWITKSLKEILSFGLTFPAKAPNSRTPNGRTKYYFPVAAPIEYSKRDLPIDPYLIGALIGNGGFSHKQASRVIFTTADLDTVNEIRRLLPPDLILKKKRTTKYDYVIIHAKKRMIPTSISTKLVALGLQGKHSWEKFIPNDYLQSSIQDRTALLQGLLDTDGYAQKHGTAIEYSTTSLALADDIMVLVRSLGGKCTQSKKYPTYRHKDELRNGRVAYRVCIHLPSSIRPFRAARKMDQYKMGGNGRTLQKRIKSVESVGVKPAQCIMVDSPDHTYITDDFIVTHNTSLEETLWEYWMRLGFHGIVWGPEWTKEEYVYRSIQRYEGPSVMNIIEHRAWHAARLRGEPENRRYGKPLTESQINKAKEIIEMINSWPGKVTYIDKMGINVADLIKCMSNFVAKEKQEKRRISFAVLDYVQLLRTSGSRNSESLDQALADFKAFCVDKQVVGLVSTQITKADGRAQASGTVSTQHVMQNVRSDYFNLILTINRKVDENGQRSQYADVRVAKNSLGKNGDVQLQINGPRLMWTDVEPLK